MSKALGGVSAGQGNRVESVKVSRYWARKRAGDAKEEEEEEDAFFGAPKQEQIGIKEEPVAAVVKKSHSIDNDRAIHDRRRFDDEFRAEPKTEEKVAAVVVRKAQPIEQVEDDEEIENRHARLRQLQRQRQQAKQEEQKKPKPESDDEEPMKQEIAPPVIAPISTIEKTIKDVSSEEEEEDSSDDEESSDEEEFVMMKPVFVPKSQRITQDELKRREEEGKAKEEERKRLIEERKKETKHLVSETPEKPAAPIAEVDEEMPDDDDNIDAEKEYALWKAREKARVKREREERERAAREKAEIEKRRNMTDEEIRKEDEEFAKLHNLPDKHHKEKAKWRYMQRYYHKGAFFMDTNDQGQVALGDVIKRDYASAPTLEDHFNKEVLPKVMQRKNFGKASQTKYTHLLDQDTIASNKDAAWADKDVSERERQRIERKGQLLNRPSKKRHL